MQAYALDIWDGEQKLLIFLVSVFPMLPTQQLQPRRSDIPAPDASERAYGAVAYLRSTTTDGGVSVRFVMSRSRLTPKRVQTMPRLELLAAVCGAELAELVESEMKMTLSIICWGDNTTVLTWTKSESCRYNRFVGARIAEIQRLTDHTTWRYVNSEQNPADDLTRGLELRQLAEPCRWHAPPFLHYSEDRWPEWPVQNNREEPESELKQESFSAVTLVANDDYPRMDATNFSTWDELVEAAITARYASKGENKPEPLSADGWQESEKSLYHQAQSESFPGELAALSSKQDILRKSRLADLSPEYDQEDRLIRVGGRLRRAHTLDEGTKHPVVLDPRHPIVQLLIKAADTRLGHCGAEAVLADLRRRFWILRGRQSIRSFQTQCVGCLRRRGRPSIPKMADLPPARLRVGRPPFYSTGTDCFGPFSVKIGRRTERRWGIIWKCMTVRAIYLDLLESLDTDAFLMSFTRFRSRRGTPHEILCDNGTNFKGGETELKKAFEEMAPSLQERLAKHQVRFKFNPPVAPHFGGTWEREIRSVKNALYAILGKQTVTPAVLYTMLVEVEGLMNSKPLSYVSSDVSDPDPITPFMLFMGR